MTDFDGIYFPSELFVGLELEFNAVRIVGKNIIPARFTISSELIPPISEIEDDDGLTVTHEYLSNACAKIKYFVDRVLNNSVLFYRENLWAAETFMDMETGLPKGDNNLVHLPGEANNAMLAEILISKFKSLTGGILDFSHMKVKSTDTSSLTFSFVPGTESELPDMEEWIGEHSYFSNPWWGRDDASTMDVIPDSDADLNSPPAFAYSLGFVMAPSPEAEDKVVRVEFRPRVIKGGKDD